MRRLLHALPLLFPAAWMLSAGPQTMGPRSLDLTGHVWTIWNTGQGAWTHSEMVAYPEGADLLPILGGWLDIFVGGAVLRFFDSPILAFNLALALFIAVAGWGGYALARALGASPLSAAVAGFLLQLDGYTLHHALGGRTEQAGVGFVALAIGAALLLHRRGGAPLVVATGAAGALVILVSWEHAMWLAPAMVVVALGLRWDRSAALRWAAAAGVTALLAGPWVAIFLAGALDVRVVDEGRGTLQMALEQSVVPGTWLRSFTRPSLAVLLGLGALALRRDRLALATAGGLVASLVLAMGPAPGVLSTGNLGVGGLWIWLQQLPVAGWFHTPDRLMVGWSLVACTGCALLLDRAGRWRPLAALVLVGGAAWHVAERPGPYGGWAPNYALALTSIPPGEGALLDLPATEPGMGAMRYQNLQLLHERPIPYHMTLPHLTRDAAAELLASKPALQAVARTVGESVPEGLEADLETLASEGFDFVVLHPRLYSRPAAAAREQALREALGAPDRTWGENWLLWELR